MDKSWVNLVRNSLEYKRKLELFLDEAFSRSARQNKIICPCKKCCNRYFHDRVNVGGHLLWYGMDPLYMTARWTHHGETYLDESYVEGETHVNSTNNASIDISDESEGGDMHDFLNETFMQPAQSVDSPIEAYELVHKRKDEQRSLIDDASEHVGALISQNLAELGDINGEVTPEIRLQAYVSARGFETGGRVRGYGEVVTPDKVPWVQGTQPTSMVRRSRKGRAYALLQSECLSLKEIYEKQQMINEKHGKEIEELRHTIQSSQNLSSNPQSSTEQPSSAPEESLNISQQLVNQHRPPNQQQSSSQQQPLFQQNATDPQFGPIYHLHPYHPSLYAQVSQPTRNFTTTLKDMDFLQFMANGSTSDK